jgi:EpsI family protein
MSGNRRYWLMIAILTVASVGLYGLSQGEPLLSTQPLSTFPRTLDGLIGSDQPMPRDILDALGVDDYLDRVYEAPNRIPISFYVGFYKSQRTGVSIHSPKNCLPGSGWEPVSSGHVQLALPDGRSALANLYIIEKGLDRNVVIYWYQSHGRIVASEYQSKIYLVLDAMRLHRTDAALVRIIVPVTDDLDSPRRQATGFAQLALIQLQNLIPH